MRVTGLAILSSWLVLAGSEASAAPESGRLERVLEAASGETVLRHIALLAPEGSPPAFVTTASALRAELAAHGYTTGVEDLSAAAEVHFPGQRALDWSVQRAEVGEPGAKRPWLDLTAAPGFVAEGSDSARVEAELVDVGDGSQAEDYAGKDVSGRLALASGPVAEVYRRAVLEQGALGVVSYLADELERGIVEASQLPLRSLDAAARAGTFAITLPVERAMTLRRALLRGQPQRLRVDLMARANRPAVQAVWAERPGALVAGARVVLLFALLDPDEPGGSATLLEVARLLAQPEFAGQASNARLVLLWVSEPAALRSFVGTRQLPVGLAWGLGDVGREGAVVRLVEPPAAHASWVVDQAGWALEASSGDLPPVRSIVEPYRRSGDPYCLNGPSSAYPALWLDAPGAPRASFGADTLRRLSAAVAGTALSALEGAPPADPLRTRLFDRLLLRHAQAMFAAGSPIASAAPDAAALEAGARRARSRVARADADGRSRLDAWEREGVAVADLRLAFEAQREARLAALRSALLAAYERAALPATPPAPSPEVAEAARLRLEPVAGAAWPEPVGSTLAFSSAGAWERQPMLLDADLSTELLGRLQSPATLWDAVQGLSWDAADVDLAAVGALVLELTARGVLRTSSVPGAEPELGLLGPSSEKPVKASRAARPTPRPAATPPPSTPAPTPLPAPTPPVTVPPSSPPPTQPPPTQPPPTQPPPTQPPPTQPPATQPPATAPPAPPATVPPKPPEPREDAKAVEARESQQAYERGLVHYTERRRDQALAEFRKVKPSTPDAYRDARARIAELTAPASAGGACQELGVLRATQARGEERVVSGQLAAGAEADYCIQVEAPGYGDLEILVSPSFVIEGDQLRLTGVKQFTGATEMYKRYAREKVASGTRIAFKITNKKGDTPEFECVIYVYPR